MAYIFPWPFILLGAGALYYGQGELAMAKMSANWPSVAGIVQSSDIEWENSNNNDGGRSAYAKVVYTYDVDGHRHTCNRVLFGDYGSSDASHADSIVSQYKPGQPVTVYYKPSDPSVAVLQPGMHGIGYLLPLLLGLVFVILGLGMLWFMPLLTASASGTPATPNTPGTPGNQLPIDSRPKEERHIFREDIK